MPSSPLAYLITFTCYGTWLHGRAPGSVDPQHNQPDTPFLSADPEREQLARQKMRDAPYYLDAPRRQVVLQTILEVAQHRRWHLVALHVRTNHVHVVVHAEAKPEKVMADFKAWASRRLKETFDEPVDRKRWTEHGNTRYLWKDEQVAAAVKYVVEEQGEALEVYCSES